MTVEEEGRLQLAADALDAWAHWRRSGLMPDPCLQEAFLIGFQYGYALLSVDSVELDA
jgi:hypothetical protein